MYVVIWEFLVREGLEAEFERIYGPAGEWKELFEKSEGFLGTELCRDESAPRRYFTLDRWVSSAAYDAFKQAHWSAYEALDERGSQLTEAETCLGGFIGRS